MREVKKLLGIAAVGAIMTVASAGEARAQSTDATTFNVTITIVESCDIHTGAATDVAFGSHSRSATTANAAGALTLNCTLDTAYNIGLSAGNHSTSTTPSASNRRMIDGTNYVPYGLYRDSSRTLFWGNSIGVDTLAGLGTGAAASVPVYGRVPSLNAPAGTYTDMITATVTY